jgi:hypothetical protein
MSIIAEGSMKLRDSLSAMHARVQGEFDLHLFHYLILQCQVIVSILMKNVNRILALADAFDSAAGSTLCSSDVRNLHE